MEKDQYCSIQTVNISAVCYSNIYCKFLQPKITVYCHRQAVCHSSYVVIKDYGVLPHLNVVITNTVI